MLKVGITGGIGSGKSAVCSILEVLGIPVYYADERAKILMSRDKVLKGGIVGIFGESAYFKNGRINRKFIAASIFSDPKKRKALNDLVHPAVARDAQKWFEKLPVETPFAVKEAALMIQSGSYRELDVLVLVTCPLEERIKRVMKRDGISRDEVLGRIGAQMSDEQMSSFAQELIINDGKKSIIRQTMRLFKKLIRLAKSY